MAIVKWTFIVVASGYLALAALMYFAQRSLMYFPERVRTAPAVVGFPEAQEVWLDTADGERVIAWHVPPRGDSPVVIYFHGNGGSIRLRVDRFQRLVAAGVGLLGVSYRGYGGSTGTPTEQGLIEDACNSVQRARLGGLLLLRGLIGCLLRAFWRHGSISFRAFVVHCFPIHLSG